MGFIDDLKKMVVGQQGEAGGQSSMLDNLLEMLNDQKSEGMIHRSPWPTCCRS